MKKKFLIILGCSILLALFIFGMLFGSFDFTCPRRLEKTNYYLIKNEVVNIFDLYYRYSEGLFVGVLGKGGRGITDVYWNDQYILAVEYAIGSDNSIRVYWILKMLPPVEKGVPWERIGPLSKKEYEEKKQELNLNEERMKHISVID